MKTISLLGVFSHDGRMQNNLFAGCTWTHSGELLHAQSRISKVTAKEITPNGWAAEAVIT